jgi:hypothetical protein
MSRGHVRDVILAHETLSELIAGGLPEQAATEAIALGIFIRRTEAMVEPLQADHDYASGALSGRNYLEQIAPEELER